MASQLRGRSANQIKGGLHATPIYHATFHAFPAACLFPIHVKCTPTPGQLRVHAEPAIETWKLTFPLPIVSLPYDLRS